MQAPLIHSLFDETTKTVTYIIACPFTKEAVVIDPVLDYDYASSKVSLESAYAVLALLEKENYVLKFILETHAHADHLSGAPFLKLKTHAKVGIGEQIKVVQKIFRPVFNALDVKGDGHEFDLLLKDGEILPLGSIAIEIIATPGHTPACISYKIGENVFVGDTLFMPDYGTARADFPGGSASQLYRSMKKLLALPPQTKLFMCHDYKSPTRSYYAWETTVEEQRLHNVHIKEGVSEADYVAMREKRDATLAAPALLLPSIQVNIRAGQFPPADKDGVHYLKVPVKFTI